MNKLQREKKLRANFSVFAIFYIIIYARFLSLAHFLIMPDDRLITLAFFAVCVCVQNAKSVRMACMATVTATRNLAKRNKLTGIGNGVSV